MMLQNVCCFISSSIIIIFQVLQLLSLIAYDSRHLEIYRRKQKQSDWLTCGKNKVYNTWKDLKGRKITEGKRKKTINSDLSAQFYLIFFLFFLFLSFNTSGFRMTGVTPGAKDPGRVDEKDTPLRRRQEGQRLHAHSAKSSP